MIKPQQFSAKLEETLVHNEKFTQFSFELLEPHKMEFYAGQYVSVKVAENGTRRSYSLCSSPDIKHGFELLIDISPAGIGSTYFRNLKFGDSIDFLGPLGMFTMAQDAPEEEIVFVATGSGIAPFRSMILDQLQVRADTRPMTLYWGLRHETDLFWEMEFQELSETHPNFTFHPVISRPGQEWTLSRGRVTDVLKAVNHSQTTGYYLCGNTAMVHDVSDLLQSKGVAQEYIHHEKFY